MKVEIVKKVYEDKMLKGINEDRIELGKKSLKNKGYNFNDLDSKPKKTIKTML